MVIIAEPKFFAAEQLECVVYSLTPWWTLAARQ
jgi:hypothetical protein